MNVSIDELTTLGMKALRRYGYTASEAKTILDVLMYAQLRGNNQGLVKLIGAGIPKDPEAGIITLEKETKLSALLNGKRNPGAVVATQAMNLAIKKAKKHSIGIVGTNNTYSSTGAIGYYAGNIARAGFIGFVFAGSPETVATYGSFEPIFGTNPLAIGVPTEKDPIVLDMATAEVAYYGLIEAKTAGRAIPEGIAYDSAGAITTDPTKAMDGAIKAFGGHKGAGIALIVEILTGPLVHASFTGIGNTKKNWGNLVIALDPELLVNTREFMKNVSLLKSRVKQTKPLPGVTEILTPGERGDRRAKKHLAASSIDIEQHLYHELKKAAGK